MECPNATRNEFTTQTFQEDVMLQVCLNFLHDVERIRFELAAMRQEMRNLRTEIQEHRVNCVQGNFSPWAPTQKGNQKTVRFCNCCHKVGHTPSWCRKKCETTKYERYDMNCPPQGIISLPRTMALLLSTAAPNTIKMWTYLLIRMMTTTQLMKFNPPKRKPGKMNLTNSLLSKQNSFTGTIARASEWHISTQLKSLTMNCPIHFRWATAALENPFLYCYLLPFVYFYIP